MKALYNSLYGLLAGTIIPQISSFSAPALKRTLSNEGSLVNSKKNIFRRSQSSIADYTSTLFYKNEMEDESIKAENISDNVEEKSSTQTRIGNIRISQIQKELQEISLDVSEEKSSKKANATFTRKEVPQRSFNKKSNKGKRKSHHIEPITTRDISSSDSETSSNKRKGSLKSPYLVYSDEDTYSQESVSTNKSRSSKKIASKSSRSRSSSWATDEESLTSFDESKISDKEKLAKLKGQRLIIQNFNRNSDAVSAIFDTSSDSEDALEPFEETRDYSQIKRRETHRQDLIAIAKQAFPPDDEMRQLYQQTMLSRETDRQSGRRFEYSGQTIDYYKSIGQHAKKTTPMHNSYLRKAYKRAIEPSQAESSSISDYGSSQGEIRKELLGVIQRDALKMHWTKADFSDKDPKIWRVVEFLQKEVLSGDQRKEKIAKVAEERDSLEGCTPFAAWHHIAFKAGKDINGNKFVSVYALRPDGLMLAHDARAHNDDSISQKEHGDHEWMHKTTSSSKKNRFSKMDELAISTVLNETTVPVTRKREKYSLDILERLENFSKNVEPHNMQAKALYEKVSDLQKGGAAHDLDKFVKSCLKDSKWGNSLLAQQGIMESRTHKARLEASRSRHSGKDMMEIS